MTATIFYRGDVVRSGSSPALHIVGDTTGCRPDTVPVLSIDTDRKSMASTKFLTLVERGEYGRNIELAEGFALLFAILALGETGRFNQYHSVAQPDPLLVAFSLAVPAGPCNPTPTPGDDSIYLLPWAA